MTQFDTVKKADKVISRSSAVSVGETNFRKGPQNKGLTHGVGMGYYCFEDDDHQKHLRSSHENKLSNWWRASFKRKKEIQSPLCSPAPTIVTNRKSLEIELFDDTYIDFMGDQLVHDITREVSDPILFLKKKMIANRMEQRKHMGFFHRSVVSFQPIFKNKF